MTVRIVLATHNAHKVEEFQAIVARELPDIEIVGYDGPEPVEDGASFAENALIKARAAVQHTGLAAIADDSGLCVDILGGAPGIFSARWAGRHGDSVANRRLLLEQLTDVRATDRGAHFISTVALARPDGRELTVEGIWDGRLATEEHGANGFGYDPIFYPDGAGMTAAELTAEAKNASSHRARAFELVIPALRSLAEEA